MTEKRKPYTFLADTELLEALKRIKERDGISESEQIRRAIRDWIEKKETGHKRVVARK